MKYRVVRFFGWYIAIRRVFFVWWPIIDSDMDTWSVLCGDMKTAEIFISEHKTRCASRWWHGPGEFKP